MPATVLHDQTATCVSGVPSVIALAQSQLDSEAADDFDVPAGQSWGITEVYAPGVYNVYFMGRAQSVDIHVYADAAGVPGSIVPGCGYSGIKTFSDSSGALTIQLPSTCVLYSPAGSTKFWLGVQPVTGTGAGTAGYGIWYWTENSTQYGDLAEWENPANGFNENCVTWGVRRTCNADAEPDQCFSISGQTDVVFQDGFGEP